MFYKHPGKLNGAFLANLIILQVFGLIILFSASYATSLNKFGNSYEYVGPQTLYAIVGLAAARSSPGWITTGCAGLPGRCIL